MKNKTILIDSHFCGPPGMSNGGYVAGLVANHIDGIAEVTLRKPTPLDTDMTIIENGEGRVILKLGEDILAEAQVSSFELDVPESPTFAEAQAASGNYPGFRTHPCPGCFVCGSQRNDDGLRIYPGAVPGKEYVATPWIPHESLTDSGTNVLPEFIWAVLDCPGAVAAADGELIPILLGKLSLHQLLNIKAANEYVVIAWLIAAEGRKYFTGTALYSTEGELCAYAKATWIKPRKIEFAD